MIAFLPKRGLSPLRSENKPNFGPWESGLCSSPEAWGPLPCFLSHLLSPWPPAPGYPPCFALDPGAALLSCYPVTHILPRWAQEGSGVGQSGKTGLGPGSAVLLMSLSFLIFLNLISPAEKRMVVRPSALGKWGDLAALGLCSEKAICVVWSL